MTESPKVVITKQRDFTHKEPVIIPSHLDDIPLISAASYIKDARARWDIHTIEACSLVKDIHKIGINTRKAVTNAMDRL